MGARLPHGAMLSRLSWAVRSSGWPGASTPRSSRRSCARFGAGMLTLPSSVRIYVATRPVDLRRGFDGLAGTVRSVLRQDPMSGHVFAFLNRRMDRAKLLVWSPSGFWLLFKRLERGRFVLPSAPSAGAAHLALEASELASMLDGIDLRRAVRGPRWTPSE